MVSTPKPPNPYDQAAAQQSSDLYASAASSIINNANEQNPYGSVSYNNIGYETLYDAKGKPSYVPRYSRDVQLSPDQQKLLGLQTQAQGNAGQAAVTASANLADQFKTSLDPSQWQAWNTGQAPQDVRQDQAPTDRAAVQDAMMSRYNENAAKQASSDDAQLAARGLNPGSQGYGSVQDSRARAFTDATNQAYLASGDEARASQQAYNQAGAQQYSQNADYSAFLNNLRQAQQQGDTAQRNQLPNEVAALMGMGQVTVPQFQPFSRQGVNAAPVGQYISDAYQNQLQASSAANQGIFGLGSSLIGAIPFSDRRLKEQIEPLGTTLAGLPLYSYRFKGGAYAIGVMADEAALLHPDAVRDRDGFSTVDYGLLHSRHEGAI
jgi:hypothetical protein